MLESNSGRPERSAAGWAHAQAMGQADDHKPWSGVDEPSGLELRRTATCTRRARSTRVLGEFCRLTGVTSK